MQSRNVRCACGRKFDWNITETRWRPELGGQGPITFPVFFVICGCGRWHRRAQSLEPSKFVDRRGKNCCEGLPIPSEDAAYYRRRRQAPLDAKHIVENGPAGKRPPAGDAPPDRRLAPLDPDPK
jgi:hypothetical protein